ncbi:MAG: hypothetical protein E6J24_16535 [Chloroflexi bacterium]|nr:MAG: hypothetical protein E6J24_16535 [Chloroflexota bacterium]
MARRDRVGRGNDGPGRVRDRGHDRGVRPYRERATRPRRAVGHGAGDRWHDARARPDHGARRAATRTRRDRGRARRHHRVRDPDVRERLERARHRRRGVAGRVRAAAGASRIGTCRGVTHELALFLVLLKDSALALGGLGSLPLIRQDLVATGIATDAQVVQALAIGRLSTGPNGLWIVSLGYQIGGWSGAAIAVLATSLPPLVMVPATAAGRRFLLTPAFAGIVRGATLATAGLLASTGTSLIAQGGVTTAWWQLAIGAAAIALTYQGRIHPGVVVVGGALIGMLLGR